MIEYIRETINRILRIGNDFDKEEIDFFRIGAINLIAFFSLFILTFYVVVYFGLGFYKVSVVFFLFLLMVIVSIVLNHKRKTKAAMVLLFTSAYLSIFYALAKVGYSAQGHVILLILLSLGVVFIEKKRGVVVLFFSTVFIYTCIAYWVDKNGGLSPEIYLPFSNYVNFAFALLTAGSLTHFIMSQVKKNINKLEHSNESLKEKNAVLAEKSELIQQQNEELKLFSSVAAHDLKTPIRNIANFLQLINIQNKEQEESQETIDEYINLSIENTEHLIEMIDSIGVYNKVVKNDEDIVLVDLNDIVENAKKFFTQKIYPGFTISSDLLPIVKGQKVHFSTIFQNVIENGYKYNEREKKEVFIQLTRTEKFFYICFKDNGIGIEESQLKKIFKPFQRLHHRSQYEGTGLGLSICQKIVEKYDGDVSAKQKKGGGTVFVFKFPNGILVD